MATFSVFATSEYRGQRSIYDSNAEEDEGNSSSRYDFCDLGESDFVHVLGILSFKGHDNEFTFYLIVADMCLCEQQSPRFLMIYTRIKPQ